MRRRDDARDAKMRRKMHTDFLHRGLFYEYGSVSSDNMTVVWRTKPFLNGMASAGGHWNWKSLSIFETLAILFL